MCGVFGVIGCEQDQASELTYLALYALQHRGQESAGMAVSDGERIRLRKGMGLASQVFGHVASGLPGGLAIGHVRSPRRVLSSLRMLNPLRPSPVMDRSLWPSTAISPTPRRSAAGFSTRDPSFRRRRTAK